jgi:curli biogenesis system outer membrane secretion channel CsgG
MKIKSYSVLYLLAFIFTLVSCTTTQNVVAIQNPIQEVEVNSEIEIEKTPLKRKVAIARFSNETQYSKGLFYSKDNDPTSKQASDILSTRLASTGKFILLERDDLDLINAELEYSGENSHKIGADFLILGSITEFGRKNVGDQNAFSRSKTQTVEAGVSIRLVDVHTGQIIYSEEAKGQAITENKTVFGMGERTDFDATLSDKAISAAISKLVENIINNCMDRPWRTFFLSSDDDQLIISGGKSQGIQVGDKFKVFEKGKKIKNPQTGMMIELPGKEIGKVIIEFSGGDNELNEFSIVTFIEGELGGLSLSSCIVKEIK